MSPAGRPEVGTPINVRIGDGLLKDLDARAYSLGISRAALIRCMLKAAQAELDDDTIGSY